MSEFLDFLGASIFNAIVLWWTFGYGIPRLAKIKDGIYGSSGRPPGVA